MFSIQEYSNCGSSCHWDTRQVEELDDEAHSTNKKHQNLGLWWSWWNVEGISLCGTTNVCWPCTLVTSNFWSRITCLFPFVSIPSIEGTFDVKCGMTRCYRFFPLLVTHLMSTAGTMIVPGHAVVSVWECRPGKKPMHGRKSKPSLSGVIVLKQIPSIPFAHFCYSLIATYAGLNPGFCAFEDCWFPALSAWWCCLYTRLLFCMAW